MPEGTIQKVSFDLDGTLYCDDGYRRAHNALFRQAGYVYADGTPVTMPDRLWLSLCGIASHAEAHPLIVRYFDEAGVAMLAHHRTLEGYVADRKPLVEHELQTIRYRDGAKSILNVVGELNLIPTLATNGNTAETMGKLRRGGLRDRFVAIGTYDHGRR